MRILLVSYYFPPANSVGAVRPGKLAAYLRDAGHDVHVLTCSNQPFPDGLEPAVPAHAVTAVPGWSVNAPVEWLRGGRDKVAREGFGSGGAGLLGRLYKTLLHWPDAQLGWVAAARRAGAALLRAKRFDVIYVSAPPFSALRVGSALARAHGIPWVAELRDLWTDNHHAQHPFWRRAIERRWESALLATASALVTVSPPLAARLARFGKPVWDVRNGCDPEDFAGLARPASFGPVHPGLEISFTGNVYEGRYDVDAFCAGLAQFLRMGDARVHVAGRNTGALREAALRHGVAHAFDFRATVPRAEALAMQRHADVLLAFLWQGGEEGVYSAKLFEYAAAGRPILAVGRSDVGALVASAELGVACDKADAVCRQLQAWQAAKQAGGIPPPAPRGFDASRRAQFDKLAHHMAALVRGG